MKGVPHTNKALVWLLTLGTVIHARADALDTWTNVATSPYGAFTQITNGNGVLVATSRIITMTGTEGGISTSADGIHWIHQNDLALSDSTPYQMSGVAYGNGAFVATGRNAASSGDGGAIFYSTNGSNWTRISAAPGLITLPGINAITYANGKFLAVGFYFETQQGFVDVSTNGQDWTYYLVGTNDLTGVAFTGTSFVAGGIPNTSTLAGSLIVSGTGTNGWFSPYPSFSDRVSKVAYVNGVLYPTVGTNVMMLRSGSWVALTNPAPSLYVTSSSTNNLYVGIGAHGGVYSSIDSTNWVTHTTGFTNDLTCITYANGRFYAAGSAGQIFVSGPVTPSLAVQNQAPSGVQLTVAGGLGPTYRLQASSDLSTWTNLTTFTDIGVSAQYLDTSAGNFPQRYYRTVSP